MDDTGEAPGDSFATIAAGKGGLEGLQMAEPRPENPFRQGGIALLVGAGKVVATWRGRGTERHQHAAVQLPTPVSLASFGAMWQGMRLQICHKTADWLRLEIVDSFIPAERQGNPTFPSRFPFPLSDGCKLKDES